VTAERIKAPSQMSTAELVNDAAERISALVRDEIQSAVLEMRSKAGQLGAAGALLGSALLLARIGLVLAGVLLVVALANVWPLWLAVAVPMAAALLLAGFLALVGRGRLARAVPPVPTAAAESVREDLRLVSDAVHEGRQS
jgi:hypothetical protein